MNIQTRSIITVTLVFAIAAPIGVSAGVDQGPDGPSNAVKAYLAATQQPIRDSLAPLIATATAAGADSADFEVLLDQLEAAEATLIEQLQAQEDEGTGGEQGWKLFAVAEGCTGAGSCGGKQTTIEGNQVRESNYISQGDVSFVTCSGNVMFTNTNVGTGAQEFCITYANQTVDMEVGDGGCAYAQEADAPGECSQVSGIGIATHATNSVGTLHTGPQRPVPVLGV